MSTQSKNYDNAIFFSTLFVFFLVYLIEAAAIHFEALGEFIGYSKNKAILALYATPLVHVVWRELKSKSERLAGKYFIFAGGAATFLIFYNAILDGWFATEATKLLACLFILVNLALMAIVSAYSFFREKFKKETEVEIITRIANLIQRHEPRISHSILLPLKKSVEVEVLVKLPSNEKTNELIVYLINVGHLKINEVPLQLLTDDALKAWREIKKS